jgi:hypothetical protein
LAALARSSGGEAPLPSPPSITDIGDVQRLVGNEQLVAIKERAADWEASIPRWRSLADLVSKRTSGWLIVKRLAAHAVGHPAADQLLADFDAILAERLLLEPSDPATRLRQQLATVLREAVQQAHQAQIHAHSTAQAALGANSVWAQLPPETQSTSIEAVGLKEPITPDVSSDETLAALLDRYPLSSFQAVTDAVAGRVVQAIEQAARFLEPKVQMVPIERSTLRDAADVEAWIERQRWHLLERVAHGPVLVN